jgi:DNA-binding transcriptional regulator PaaX
MKKNFQITKEILKSVAKNTAATVSHIADLILGSKYNGYRDRFRKSYLKRRFHEMLDRGLISINKENGKNYVQLTKKGEEKLERYELGELTVRKPKSWDGKWRLVIFDIREKRRVKRDLLRQQLQGLGLIRLQNSVWVYPYDFSEVAVLLKADAMIGKDILFLIVEELENDGWLRKHFGL